MLRAVASLSALIAVLATTAVALKPLVKPSACASNIKCCNGVTAGTTLTPIPVAGRAVSPDIFPAPGLYAYECSAVASVASASTCNGMLVCCPNIIPLVADDATPTATGPFTGSPSVDCSLIDWSPSAVGSS